VGSPSSYSIPPQTAEIDKANTQKSNATYKTKYSSNVQLRINCQAISLTIESPLQHPGGMLSGEEFRALLYRQIPQGRKVDKFENKEKSEKYPNLLHKHCIFLPNMPFTILVAISAIFGTSEAIRHTQSKARKDEHCGRHSHLIVRCSKSSQYSSLLQGRRIVLLGDKVFDCIPSCRD
jgi:hypothetical protein